MITDHMFQPSYAGVDESKQLCEFTCGKGRSEHELTVETVNHPDHYAATVDGIGFECIELVRRLTFDVGNAVKYIWRTDWKNGREDIEKAQWYIRDAHKVDDYIFAWRRLSEQETTKRMLTICIDAQTVPARRDFFTALREGDLKKALVALEDMLQ